MRCGLSFFHHHSDFWYGLTLVFCSQDSTGYQITLLPEIEARLKAKCDRLASAFEIDEAGE